MRHDPAAGRRHPAGAVQITAQQGDVFQQPIRHVDIWTRLKFDVEHRASAGGPSRGGLEAPTRQVGPPGAQAGRCAAYRRRIGRIERGAVVPRASTVRALAKALGVPVSELIVPVRALESVRFRAKAQVRSREHILAAVSKWLEGYAWLEEELGERARFAFGKARPPSGDAVPDAVARAAREAVGLAPEVAVRDICGLLDRGGVKLLLLETKRDSFFGMEVIDVETPTLLAAAEVKAPVSFNDSLCFVVCRERGWTCVTNDRALTACAAVTMWNPGMASGSWSTW